MTILDIDGIMAINLVDEGVQLSLLGATSTVGWNVIEYRSGTIILRPNIVTPIGININEVAITRSSISMAGTMGRFNILMSLDRKRKAIIATITNLVEILSYIGTVDIISRHIASIDSATITVIKDDGYDISMVVDGTIFHHDVRMALGWLPHKYVSMYLSNIDPNDIIPSVPILGGVSFSNVYVISASEKVTIDIEYEKGFHLRGQLNLGNVHPTMSVVKVLLSSTSSMSMFIGGTDDDGSSRPWNLDIRRMDETIINVKEMSITVGEASIKVNHEGHVTISMEVSITFTSIPILDGSIVDLTLATRFNIDVKDGVINIVINITEPVQLMTDIDIRDIELKTMATYDGPILDIDTLMDMITPDRIEFEATVMAWKTETRGSITIDEEVMFQLEVLEPMSMITTMMGTSDIMPLMNIIHPTRISMYGATKPPTIRLGGTVSTVSPMDEYRLSPVELEKMAYILQEVIASIIGQVTLSVDANIDVKTPRNSNLDMTIDIIHDLQLLGFTFTGSSIGVRITGKPSVGIIMAIELLVPPHNDKVRFALFMDASPTEVAVQMSMLHTWNDVLGIEGISIGDLGMMASKAYAEIASSLPALAVPGVNVGAVINVIRPSNVGITGTVGIRDPRYPDEEPFIVHATMIAGTNISELSLEGRIDTGTYGNLYILANRLHRLFTGGHPIDPVVGDTLAMVTLDEAMVRFVPTGTRIGDITIDQGVGLLFRAMIESPIVDGTISLEGSMEMGSGITVKGDIPDIVIPNVIEVRRSIFDVSVMWSRPIDSYIQLDAQVTLLDTLTSSTRMDVSRNGIEYEGYIHSPGGYIRVGATVKKDPSATLDVEISNPMAIITDTVDAAETMARGAVDQYVAIYSGYYDELKAQYGHITRDHVKTEIEVITSQMRSFIGDNLSIIRNTATNLVDAIVKRDDAQSNRSTVEAQLTSRLRDYGDYSVDRIPSAISDAERQRREAESRRNRLKVIKDKLDGCTGIWAGICIAGVLWEYKSTLINLAISAIASGITKAYNDTVALVSRVASRLSNLRSIKDAWDYAVNLANEAINRVISITSTLTDGIRDISGRLASMVKDSVRLFLLSIIHEANVPIKVTDITAIDVIVPPIIGSMRAAVDGINAIIPSGLPKLSFDINTAAVYQLFKDVVSDVSGALTSPYERYMDTIKDRPYLAEAEPPHPFLIPHDEKMAIMNNMDVRMEMWHLYAIVSNPSAMVIILNYIVANTMKGIVDNPFIDRIMDSLNGMISIDTISFHGSVSLSNATIRSDPVTLSIAGRNISIGEIDIDVRDIVVSMAQRILDATYEIIVQQ